MAIADLKPGDQKVNVKGEIVSVGDVREINKYGRSLRVASAVLKDESGTIQLVLWNDDIDKVKAGNVVQIENGYVNEWQGTSQLTSGKFGKLTIV